MSAQTHNRLLALQGLRAIAAGMVVFAHAFSTYSEKIGAIEGGGIGFSFGSFGVKLFFCISGFIIYTSSKSLVSGPAAMRLFVKKRVIRVVPIYWMVTLIYAAKLTLQGLPPSAADLIQSLLFIPYADHQGLMRPVLGAGWTLNYEMFFYGALAIGLCLPGKLRYGFVAVTFFAMLFLRHSGLWLSEPGALGHGYFLMADHYLLFFLLGMGVGVGLETAPMAIAKIQWHFGLLMCSMLMAVFIASCLYLHVPEAPQLSLELLLCPSLIALAASSRGEASGGSILANLAVKAGDGSYSTYLTHGFVMGPVARLLALAAPNVNPMAFALTMVLVCTAVGFLIYKHIETPIIRHLNRRFN